MNASRINTALTCSLVAIGLAAIIVVATGAPVIAAMLRPGADVETLDSAFASHMSDQAENLELDRDRFDGRSIFFKPPPLRRNRPAPPVTRTPPPERPATPTPTPTPSTPPPPRNYSGPGINAIVGSTVWFDDKRQLTVGQEQDGLAVIETNPPWSATLSYRGWEGDVSLFDEPVPLEAWEGDESAVATLQGIIPADETDEETLERLTELRRSSGGAAGRSTRTPSRSRGRRGDVPPN